MNAGDHVVMSHPDGFATIVGGGGQFVGWIPNGVAGTVYLLTPNHQQALVNFDGKFLTTVPVVQLQIEALAGMAPAA